MPRKSEVAPAVRWAKGHAEALQAELEREIGRSYHPAGTRETDVAYAAGQAKGVEMLMAYLEREVERLTED